MQRQAGRARDATSDTARARRRARIAPARRAAAGGHARRDCHRFRPGRVGVRARSPSSAGGWWCSSAAAPCTCSACCGEYSGAAYLCRALGGLRRHPASASTWRDPVLPGYARSRATRSAAPARSTFPLWLAPSRRDAERAPPALRTEDIQRFLSDVDAVATSAALGVDFALTSAQRKVADALGNEVRRTPPPRGPGPLSMGRERGCSPRTPTGHRARPPHARAGGVRRNAWQALVDEPVQGPRVETHARCEVARIVARLEGGYRVETADGRAFEAPLVCGLRVLETPMLLRRSLAATARSVHAQGATSATTSRATRRGRCARAADRLRTRRPACRATRR